MNHVYLKYITYIIIITVFNVSLFGQTQLTNIPTFYITTINSAPIINTDDYVSGKVTILSSVSSECIKDSFIQIRGRGNSTWNFMPKKSYRIKFGVDTRILNMPSKEKDWVLLANYADKTLLRNAVAFEIGRQLGMEYSPPIRFADVFLNGVFIGNYQITDQIEVNKNRVPVEKQDSFMTDLPDISGGYLLEINGYLNTFDSPVYLKTAKGLNVIVKYPKDDEINAQQKSYVFDYVRNFESILFSEKFKEELLGYRNLVDTNALINWYLACELTGNPDCFYSTYFYKKRNNDRLYFGPLWDYDIAFSNDDRLGESSGKLMRIYAHNPKTWIARFYADPWFQKKVYSKFMEMKNSGLLQYLLNYIDSMALEINASQLKNFQCWDILNKKIYRETAVRNTYTAELDYLKKYLNDRFAYLETGLAFVEPPLVSSNINSINYYQIINKKNGKVIDVEDQSIDNDAKIILNTSSLTSLSQQWKFEKTKLDNIYYITNRLSGKVLQTNTERGSQLFQNTKTDDLANQQWNVIALDFYYSGIQNTLTSKYSINNSSGSANDGNPIIQYTNNISGSENQQWGFLKRDTVVTGIEIVKRPKFAIKIVSNLIDPIARVYFEGFGDDDVVFSIYSCLGHLIYTSQKQKIHAGAEFMPLNVRKIAMVPGIYIIKMNVSNGYSTSAKIIIN